MIYETTPVVEKKFPKYFPVEGDKFFYLKLPSIKSYLKCGGKAKKVEKKATGGPQGKKIDTPNGPIFETENGYVDVDGRSVDYNNKLQNIRDRHNTAKKRVFAQGNTSYDMTIGPDLDLFNDFNGKTDTLIRKSVGFRSPKEYSNEDLGHRLETIFPRAAKFFGYKSGFQKALDDINKMEPGGKVDPVNNRQQYKMPMKVTRPVPGGGEAIMYPGLKDTMFEFMPDPGKRVIVNTKDSVGTGFDINGNINKIPADSTAKIKIMLDQVFNTPVKK